MPKSRVVMERLRNMPVATALPPSSSISLAPVPVSNRLTDAELSQGQVLLHHRDEMPSALNLQAIPPCNIVYPLQRLSELKVVFSIRASPIACVPSTAMRLFSTACILSLPRFSTSKVRFTFSASASARPPGGPILLLSRGNFKLATQVEDHERAIHLQRCCYLRSPDIPQLIAGFEELAKIIPKLRETRVLFTFSPSAICFPPSGPSSLFPRD